jgi:hypothetical protein
MPMFRFLLAPAGILLIIFSSVNVNAKPLPGKGMEKTDAYSVSASWPVVSENINASTAVAFGSISTYHFYTDPFNLNVRDFGAAGDGVQNDAPAFQKAIDAAAKQMKPLQVPSGKYYFPAKSTLILPSGITIEGSGRENCILFTDSVTDAAYPALINIQGENITIKSLAISGGRPVAADQRSTTAGGRYNLINISFDTKASKNILIENCRLSDAYGRGILFRGTYITVRDCEFLRIGRYTTNFKAVDGAISNFGRNECADIRILHNTFKYVGTHAVSAFRINRLNIEDNHLSQISGIGLANHQCQNLRITGNRIEYTGDNGIDVQRCQQTLISANYFYAAGNKNAGDAGSAAAIFYGDDYAQNTASNGIISENFIRGAFAFGADTLSGKSQSCGIYIIDAFHVKVLHNTISGIGDMEQSHKLNGIEDGNGIMVVNSAKGQSRDVLLDGNSIYDTKHNGLFVNGQSRDLKVINNNITAAGGHGIYFSSVATNLFGIIKDNTVTDGRNWFNKSIAADILIEGKNGWITHLNVSGNQLRNNKRSNHLGMSDSVATTHGIYFTGKGFAKFNNVIVEDNQSTGHSKDEIGFADIISSYVITADKPFPVTTFRNNYSGSTDDQPQAIIPGYHQQHKPWIITESYGFKVPDYGNYAKGSVVHNLTDPAADWIALNSGFAAQNRWEKNKPVQKGQVIYTGDQVWRCIVAGRTGTVPFTGSKGVATDGSVRWESMGQRVLFSTLQKK